MVEEDDPMIETQVVQYDFAVDSPPCLLAPPDRIVHVAETGS